MGKREVVTAEPQLCPGIFHFALFYLSHTNPGATLWVWTLRAGGAQATAHKLGDPDLDPCPAPSLRPGRCCSGVSRLFLLHHVTHAPPPGSLLQKLLASVGFPGCLHPAWCGSVSHRPTHVTCSGSETDRTAPGAGSVRRPSVPRAKAASLVLISKLPKNEDQKEVGVFHKMLARLKCARTFAKRKALIHSLVHSFIHSFI